MPQVVPSLPAPPNPADTALHVRFPVTSVGVGDGVVVPLPRSPLKLSPQQNNVLPLRIPHTVEKPAENDVHAPTGVGVWWTSYVPSPIIEPQHDALPVRSTA